MASLRGKLPASRQPDLDRSVRRLDDLQRGTRRTSNGRPSVGLGRPVTSPPRNTLTSLDRTRMNRLGQDSAALRNLVTSRRPRDLQSWNRDALRALGNFRNTTDRALAARSMYRGYALGGRDTRNLLTLARGWDPRGREIVDRVLTGGRLSHSEMAYLYRKMGGAANPWIRGTIGAAIREAKEMRRQGRMLGMLCGMHGGRIVVGGPCCWPNPCQPGGGDPSMDDDTDVGNATMASESGLCPRGVPVLTIPCDPAQAEGPAADVSVLPDEADPGHNDTNDAAIQADPSGDAIDATQKVRYIQLQNATKEPVEFNIRYRTYTDQGQDQWFPNRPAKKDDDAKVGDDLESETLKVRVEPGKTVNLEDNGWRVNASQVRIWAKNNSQKWEQFRNQTLQVVPEKDGYQAAVPQTLVYRVR